MNATRAPVGILRAKALALAVDDLDRAKRFYGETLGLVPDGVHDGEGGFQIGETVLLLKPNWYARPTEELNARITLEVEDARETGKLLRERGVTLPDPVTSMEGFHIGSFLDSEGNKLWFCSDK